MELIFFYVLGLQDEPLPIANAHALHGVPLPAAQSSPASTQSNQPPAPTANQLKDDGLSHAESKIDEDKLQVIMKRSWQVLN